MGNSWAAWPLVFMLTSALCQPAMAQGFDLPAADDLSPRDHISANIDLAWDYANGGDVSRALTELARWESSAPVVADYPFTRGLLLYEQGDYARALDGFSRAIDLQASAEVGLWSHLYAADILLMQRLTSRAKGLLVRAARFEGTPRSLLFMANLQQRIRIREVELTEVNEVGGITYYLPPYLIPPKHRPALYAGIEQQWSETLAFLGLSPDTPAPIVYLYPSERLYRKFFPVNADLTRESYAHQEVHIIYPESGDLLPVLAPYGLHLMQRMLNRHGTPFYLLPGGLDDAIRGTTDEGLELGAYCYALKQEGRLPAVESLLDPRNQQRIPPEVAEPMMGLVLRMLREKLKLEDLRRALVQPAFLAALPRGTNSWQPDFDAFLTEASDLLQDPRAIGEAIDALPDFAPIPLIDPLWRQELLAATEAYEAGDKVTGRAKVEAILAREPRYGEARYLLAKELYEAGKLEEARLAFERVLQDTAPHSSAVAFSHFYLGRLVKLQTDFTLAAAHYEAALLAGLPEPRRSEAQHYLLAIQRYVALSPAGEAAGPDTKPFFAELDAQAASGFAWWDASQSAYLSPDMTWEIQEQLRAVYTEGEAATRGIAWQHRVLKSGPLNGRLIAVEVEVRRVDAEGKVARGTKPERRRLLLQIGTSPWQIVDVADEADMFRLRPRMMGVSG